jgi:hypothetical protein
MTRWGKAHFQNLLKPEVLARHSEMMRAAYRAKPTLRLKHKRRMLRLWQDPNFRVKMERAYVLANVREKHGTAMRRKWEDPDFRKKMALRNKPNSIRGRCKRVRAELPRMSPPKVELTINQVHDILSRRFIDRQVYRDIAEHYHLSRPYIALVCYGSRYSEWVKAWMQAHGVTTSRIGRRKRKMSASIKPCEDHSVRFSQD